MKIPKPHLNRPGKQAPSARTIREKTRTLTGRAASRHPKWCHLFTGKPAEPEEEDR